LITGHAEAAENVEATSVLVPLCVGRVSESSLSSICIIAETTVAVSTDYDVAIWTLEHNDNDAKCEAKAAISTVRDMHYLAEQDTLICAGSYLSTWRVRQNEIDVLGTLIAVDEHFPGMVEFYLEIALTQNNKFFAASTTSVDSIPVVGRVNDLQGSRSQAIHSAFGAVAWKKDGPELFLTEWQDKEVWSEAIVLRTLSGLKLSEPRSKFRTTLNDRTTEVTSDQAAQNSAKDLPIRTRIDNQFGIKTAFDSEHVFLSLYTDLETDAAKNPEDVRTHEIWDVTDEDKCELVRIFSETDLGPDRQCGDFVGCLTVNAIDHQTTSAHFIFVYERGLIDLAAAPAPLVMGIGSSAFIPMPNIASLPDQVGLVSAACISTDGLRIATAHESGHVIIWRYSRDPNVP